jgi:hypothetical protein
LVEPGLHEDWQSKPSEDRLSGLSSHSGAAHSHAAWVTLALGEEVCAPQGVQVAGPMSVLKVPDAHGTHNPPLAASPE